MKTIISMLITLLVCAAAQAQSKYTETMLNALEKLNAASNPTEFTDAANIFERIGNMEQNEWLPSYYVAYSCIVVSFFETEATKKDALLDKAQRFIDKGMKVAPEESELFTLQAFLYPSRIMIDPMNRGMELMGKMNAALDKAIQLNPENPRSYYLRAVTVLNMPEGFGGGKATAKPIFDTAQKKFENFTPKTAIHPNWGKEQNEQELSKF